MRRLVFLPILLITSLLHAQDSHTIYYKNGKKAMEGRWRYVNESFFFPGIFLNGIMHREYADDEPQMARRKLRGINDESPTLSIVCEGPVKLWYTTGYPKAEITFISGIANGPYKSYYQSGKISEEGMLKDGQPEGLWTCYRTDGEVEFTGTYKGFSQGTLDAKWKTLFKAYDRLSRPNEEEAVVTDTVDEDYEQAVAELERPFHYLDARTKNFSPREGRFTFYQAKGKPLAIMHYANNLRNGLWEYYNRPGHKSLSIVYHAGKVISTTDSSGTQMSADSLVAQWKRNAPVRAAYPVVEAPPARPPAIFRYVEQQPSFQGDLNKYLKMNLRFPKDDSETEGRVVVQFVVQPDGSITDAKVVRSLKPAFDAEALRLIRSMPRWMPGKQNGVAVPVYFTLPITFRRE